VEKTIELNEIISQMTQGRFLSMYTTILGVVWMLFVFMMILAVIAAKRIAGGGANTLFMYHDTTRFTNNFKYEQQPDSIRYPTCVLYSNEDIKKPLVTMTGTYLVRAGPGEPLLFLNTI
jgi:hypothetical protein